MFDGDLGAELVALSATIHRSVPSEIVLDEGDMLPHLTVYSTVFPTRSVDLVVPRLVRAVSETAPFTIELCSTSCFSGRVFVDAQPSPTLASLHRKVLENLNDLRDGVFDHEELLLEGLTDEMRRSVVETGMWAAGEIYRPHVTIAKPFDQARCDEASGLLPTRLAFEMVVRQLSLVETGPNGACQNVLHTVPLSA